MEEGAQPVHRGGDRAVRLAGPKACAGSDRPHVLTGWLALNLLNDLPRADRGDLPWKAILERAAALADRGPDPRVADALSGAIVRLGHRASPAALTALFEALVQQRDPRQAKILDTWAARQPVEHRGELAVRVVALRADDVLVDSAWEKLRPERAPQFQRLFASIAENPDDLKRRQVFADALLSEGNPLGELIQLQCTEPAPPEADERLKELRRLGRIWVGPLHRMLTDVEYARGFPARARVLDAPGLSDSQWDDLLGDDRLATFDELRPGKCSSRTWIRLLRSPMTTGLKTATVRNADELEAAANRPHRIPAVAVQFAISPTELAAFVERHPSQTLKLT